MNAFRGLAAIAAIGCSCLTANAVTIDLNTANSGWKASNTAFGQVGYSIGRHVGRAAPVIARSYLTFDLSSVSKPVVAAELRMFNGTLVSPDAAETINLYDISTPLAELISTSGAASIFDDLGAGVAYGANSEFAPGVDAATIRSFSLNAAALAAINANLGGAFAMGAAMESYNPAGTTSEITNSDVNLRYSTLRLTLVPEPSAAFLLVPAAVAILTRRRLVA